MTAAETPATFATTTRALHRRGWTWGDVRAWVRAETSAGRRPDGGLTEQAVVMLTLTPRVDVRALRRRPAVAESRAG